MNTEKGQDRTDRGPSQKTMLSKALQKANAAVLLDNATNYEGAIDAYNDACQLLQQVMHRSGGNDEKQKLEEIRNTYSSRINELRRLGLSSQQVDDGKALPDPPPNEESPSDGIFTLFPDAGAERQDTHVLTTTTAKLITSNPPYASNSREQRSLAPSQIPPRRQSLLPSTFDEDVRLANPQLNPAPFREHSQSKSLKKDFRIKPQSSTETLKNSRSDPSTLGEMPSSPSAYPQRVDFTNRPSTQVSNPLPPLVNQHSRDASNGSTSWLDTIDESGASSNSSIRSRSSLLYIRPKLARNTSGGTEAEFDAALDAAVEAAYDEGFEPANDADTMYTDDIVSNVRRNVELAKQKVREVQLESEAVSAKNREKRRILEEPGWANVDAIHPGYDDDVEAEEEERILEEMMADFEFDLQSKSALPRQSDSSGFSGRTWGSSVASNLTTAGTSLSTLAEGVEFQPLDARMKSTSSPPHPPPVSALPQPPVLAPTFAASLPSVALGPISAQTTLTGSTGVRGRRLNGQNPAELSIETISHILPDTNGPQTAPMVSPVLESVPKTCVPISQDSASEIKIDTAGSPTKDTSRGSDPVEAPLTDSIIHSTKLQPRETHDNSFLPSPSRMVAKVASAPENLRKNISSSSLKAMKARGMSVSTPDIPTQAPGASYSATFANLDQRKVTTPSLPPAHTPTNSLAANSIHAGGLNLFDSNIHSPTTPGSPNLSVPYAPLPLEPCPQSFLLRPFWLMRCLYQTIAHPRGGYLTTKLFIPRDVWRVQNVKLKGVEEKISSCDLLTAALLKLAKADTYDADAVLEEMQSLETILDQVQNIWSKKLGNEVGVQGSMSLFKSTIGEDMPTFHDNAASKPSGGSSKSYLTSWRKLRSKSSGTGGPTSVSVVSKYGSKDTLTMNSLPMTDSHGFRTPKRNVTQLQCTGPNASYMGALARLFDAAQVLDQIARQVEDPGLKHSSQTLVGLELSTRHASEFFGFYVCRFALNDIALMIDKFVKRGSEWVLV
ncbi:uncharacterized protein PADG_05330 [Paracoccidioides brasiliensis Pb18]|uniref:MIT domain-containing protein n=1 Tax=Paracoccidioides brasiliensis (strain Pb18) TaxID=502780 RepID=C1GDJ4_PARBD|nr:uncharacterized protein PADG_05330 [Paracoccidioides brasiliensis Pb18]EEH49251.2 hypothetical protein PADG_05330 [Paracoccidioides brasiliensis Pb18]ODH46264.1 hypothetical protein GX48_07636 [Paracoccidioides brasiliensis]